MRRLLLAGLAATALPAWATPVSQCSRDDDCLSRCAAHATELGRPKATDAGFASATCAPYNSTGIMTTGCWCQETSGGGSRVLFASDAGCHLSGRDGKCLFQSDEFQACIDASGPNDALCRPQCDTLAGRLQTDAARQLTFTVMGASCWKTVQAGRCDCAFQLDDTCFVNHLADDGSTTYDCSRDAKDAIRELSTRGCSCSSAAGGLALVGLLALALTRRRS